MGLFSLSTFKSWLLKGAMKTNYADYYYYCYFFLNITYANIMRSISPVAGILPSFPVSVFHTNLVCVNLGHSSTAIALVPIFRARWFEDGHDLGLGYFVKESKICNIFA